MQATLTPVGKQSARKQLAPLPLLKPDAHRVAVLLNKNARRVSDGMAEKMASIVGRENLYYSRSLEEAEAYAREIVQRGYGTVVCAGGDGTLARTVNLVQRYVAESNSWRIDRYHRSGERQVLLGNPRFAFLRCGTGNGIAPVVGAENPVQDLSRIVLETPSSRSIPLIDVDGERCFFAGLGYDSLLLNDYNWLKNHTKNPLLRPMMHSVAGYFAAMLSRTLPTVLSGKGRLEARVVTRGPAYYVDPRSGDAVRAIAPGTEIFQGPAVLIGAGTVPFYGYGFRIFPFANMMPDMMHLRIGRIGPVSTLANLPGLWKGSYRNAESLMDFIVSDVDIELAQPFPFQHSGDAQGMRKNLRLRIAEDTLDLVDLHRPRYAN